MPEPGAAGGIGGRVTELWRYPVKSMQGEPLDAASVSAAGLLGDRAWAAVDVADGRVGSAKHPRNWSDLLQCRAATVTGEDGTPAGVQITMPDGSTVREGPDVDGALSDLLGRPVKLVPAGTDANAYEGIWPDIEGLAPDFFIAATRSATASPESEGAVLDLTVGAETPGALVDVAALHILTRNSLSALTALAPDAEIGVQRFRPNIVVDWHQIAAPDADATSFVEDAWAGEAIQLGAVTAQGMFPTMRCIMTTLAQPGLPKRPEVLRALATHHRVDIFGGMWASLGLYASVTAAGALKVGDPVAIATP